MHIWWAHVQDDPAPPCSGRASPKAQGPGGHGGALAVRIPSPGGAARRRAPDARRASRPPGPTERGQPAGLAGPGGAGRTGSPVIVVDASAAIELLLNTAAGIRISARLLSSGETLHAPHLIDLEVAQVLRRYARSGE